MESQDPRSTGQSIGAQDGIPGIDGQADPRTHTDPGEELRPNGTIVVKIGGSTLGSGDTTLEDLVTLQRRGINPIVVHGGGKLINEWLERQGVRPRFVRGLRVTDARSLEVVVAVLTGLINKKLVASLQALGGSAMGISGVDGGMLLARVKHPELGLVGSVAQVNPDPIKAVLEMGFMPVIAPVAVQHSDGATSRDRCSTLTPILPQAR